MKARALACLSLALAAPMAMAQMDGSEYVRVQVDPRLWPTATDGVYQAYVTFVLSEGWHIYWKNPGDSGAPPSMKWELPKDMEFVGLQWPAPHRINTGGIVSYGYEGSATLVAQIRVPKGTKPGTYDYSLNTDFLVCKDLCLPGTAANKGKLEILNDYSSSILPPLPLAGKPDSASFKAEGDNIALTFDVPQLAGLTVSNAYFFPASEATIDHGAEQKWKLAGTKLTLTVKKSEYATKPFSAIEGVLVINATKDDKKQQIAIEYTKPQEKQE